MPPLELHGLTADSAHGFLAGIGVLEALRGAGIHARLSWSDGFYPHAILHGVPGTETLYTAILTDRDTRLAGPVLNHPTDNPFTGLSQPAHELTHWARIIAELDDNDPDVDLWSALVIEGGYDNNEKSKPTHFNFAAGQVRFLDVARQIGRALDADRLDEAINGPWRYDSTLATLRFEKEGERIRALRGIPPGDDALQGVPGADWLAFRGLAFYPLALAPGRGDRAHVLTPACDPGWNESAYRWVVWSEPLDRQVIAALVTDPTLVATDPDRRRLEPAALAARGIRSVWESPIRRAQKYGSFGPPKQIARA